MGQDQELPLIVDSATRGSENFNVVKDMSVFRENVTVFLKNSYDSLPETTVIQQLQLDKYIQENPQSTIFIPEKDLHLFPIIVNEAEKFLNSFDKLNGALPPNKVMEHEYEHIKYLWESDNNLGGVGLVLFKINGKPEFGGFVTAKKGEELSLFDRLSAALAPDKPSTGDWLMAANILLEGKGLGEIVGNVANHNTLMLLSNKILPPPFSALVNNFLKSVQS
jgi:hypothetical protein